MNREQLEARRAEFTQHRAANGKELAAARDRVTYLQATDNTLHGVIQDCEHWLAHFDARPENQPDPPPRTAMEAGAALIAELQTRKAKREGASA